jgi:hypothetical protein
MFNENFTEFDPDVWAFQQDGLSLAIAVLGQGALEVKPN